MTGGSDDDAAQLENANRRHHQRLGIAVQVGLTHGGTTGRHHTADVSAGGLAVEDVPLSLAVGDTVGVDVYLAGVVVHATGVVVWRGVVHGSGPRCGIAFETFEGDGQRLIERFVRGELAQAGRAEGGGG